MHRTDWGTLRPECQSLQVPMWQDEHKGLAASEPIYTVPPVSIPHLSSSTPLHSTHHSFYPTSLFHPQIAFEGIFTPFEAS